MNVNFRSIGFSLTDEDRAFMDKKLAKLRFAEDYLLSVDITARRESKGIGFHFEGVLSFSWHKDKAVSQDSYELYEGIELLADKIQSAAKKEKEKTMGL